MHGVREREVYSPSGSHSESNSKRQESVRTTVNWCLGPGTDSGERRFAVNPGERFWADCGIVCDVPILSYRMPR